MSQFTIPGVNPNPAAIKNVDLMASILAIPSLQTWHQAEATRVTLTDGTTIGVGTEINSFKNLKGGADDLPRGGAGSRAELLNNGLNGWSVADFNKATNDRYHYPGTFNFGEAFTWVVVFKQEDNLSNQALLSGYVDNNSKCFLWRGTNATFMRFQYGLDRWIIWTVPTGDWHTVIAQFDGAETLTLWADGAIVGTIAKTQADFVAPLVLGDISQVGANPFDGKVSDVMTFNAAIMNGADGEKNIRLIQRYAQAMYKVILD